MIGDGICERCALQDREAQAKATLLGSVSLCLAMVQCEMLLQLSVQCAVAICKYYIKTAHERGNAQQVALNIWYCMPLTAW